MSKFLDVDFTQCPEYVKGYDAFGELPCAAYGDSAPVYTLPQIREHAERLDAEATGLEWLVTRIYDQGNEGSCVANAASQAFEIVQAAQNGRDKVIPLSAISLYKRIGRSPGSGAMVSDGLKQLQTRGILPLDTPENRARFKHTMPARGFYSDWPAGWEETANQFKVVEWLVCNSAEEVLSAGINGHPVCVGRAGHSICYTRPTMKTGRLCSLYANSWRPTWGDAAGYMPGGFGYDSEGMVRSASSWAYAIRAVKAPQ